MNILKKFFLIITIFFFQISSSNSLEKIVFLDIDYILNNSNLGKSIHYDLEKINSTNIKILNSKEKILKEKKDSINNKKNIVSKEILENEISLFNDEVKKYRIEKDKLIKEFKIKKQSELDNFLIKIDPLIKEYMKTNSIDIVLEKNQIFIGNTTKDITNAIIELINKNFSNNG